MSHYFFVPSLVLAQIDVPVDLLTGRPMISLPIASIGNGSISAGVSVSYDGDGYRIGDTEGSAGVNWSLIAGGQISRW
ncbi:MAG: hypothetical protein IPJ20_23530 [Flammeovirgaceae bacterium]|nr:hypothetical protein [Flammeovirgaceae bacterium]